MSEPEQAPETQQPGYFKVPAQTLLQVNQILSGLPYGQVAAVMAEIGKCQHVRRPITPDLNPPEE